MFRLSKTEKQYRSSMATFELGYLGNDKEVGELFNDSTRYIYLRMV